MDTPFLKVPTTSRYFKFNPAEITTISVIMCYYTVKYQAGATKISETEASTLRVSRNCIFKHTFPATALPSLPFRTIVQLQFS